MPLHCFLDRCSSEITSDGVLKHDVTFSAGKSTDVPMDSITIWVFQVMELQQLIPTEKVAKDRTLRDYDTDEGMEDLNRYLVDILECHVTHSGKCDFDTLWTLFGYAMDFIENTANIL